MRPVYGRSPWVDQFPRSRVPAYPKFRGTLHVDAAIIGGGLTGCTAAQALAAAGMSVALFEADRVGRGASGASTGWILDEPPVSFAALEASAGRRAARQAFQAWRRAALDFAALMRRLDLKCRLEPTGSLTASRTADEEETLRRDHARRREAGLDATRMAPRAATAAVGFAAVGALRSRGAFTLDPYRATLGLAAAAAAGGAQIFERSPVTRSASGRDEATLTVATGTAAAGTVRARHVIVATDHATALFKPLARHVTVRTRYAALTEPVPARIRQQLGSREFLVRDLADPPHRIAWVDDTRLLVSGADGDVVPARSRERVLVQRTAQLMYELSTLYPDISGLLPAYGWEIPLAITAHGLPVIGPHRNYPHHLFALGGGHSVTSAYLASRILLRRCRGEAEPTDDVFGFVR